MTAFDVRDFQVVNHNIVCENEAFPVVHEAINEWIEDKLKII